MDEPYVPDEIKTVMLNLWDDYNSVFGPEDPNPVVNELINDVTVNTGVGGVYIPHVITGNEHLSQLLCDLKSDMMLDRKCYLELSDEEKAIHELLYDLTVQNPIYKIRENFVNRNDIPEHFNRYRMLVFRLKNLSLINDDTKFLYAVIMAINDGLLPLYTLHSLIHDYWYKIIEGKYPIPGSPGRYMLYWRYFRITNEYMIYDYNPDSLEQYGIAGIYFNLRTSLFRLNHYIDEYQIIVLEGLALLADNGHRDASLDLCLYDIRINRVTDKTIERLDNYVPTIHTKYVADIIMNYLSRHNQRSDELTAIANKFKNEYKIHP